MSVITRQYAPPTCTLEITAQVSALSRWTRQPVVKSLNFLLSFEGLNDQNHQPLEVRGDQEQLEVLALAVTDYVQNLLGHYQADLDGASTIRGNPSDFPGDAEQDVTPVVAIAPHLQPQSMLTHTLFLGPLASHNSTETIPLKVSQLFDLVSALDEYAEEVERLPSLVPQPKSWVQAAPVWARAAGILALLGGATVALQATDLLNLGGSSPVATEENSPVVRPETPVPVQPSAQPPQTTTALLPTSPSPEITLPKRTTTKPFVPSPVPPTVEQRRRSQQRPTVPRPTVPRPSIPPITNIPTLDRPELSVPPVLEPPAVILSQRSPAEPSNAPEKDDAQESPVPQPPVAAAEPLPQNPQPAAPSVVSESSDLFGAAANQPLKSAAPLASRARRGLEQRDVAIARPPKDLQGQVLEARQILKQWQAPAQLSQTLAYTLSLNPDGSIQRVIPLGKAAEEYLNQTPLTTLPQPFVSPRLNNKSSKMRVVLFKNGKVKILPERTQ